jgi:hypothetical protein
VPIEEEEDCHKKGLADIVPGDQKVSVHLTMKNSEYSKSPHATD